MEQHDPRGLSMTVNEVFFINAPGKGTVLTGYLDGAGLLRVGDSMACGERAYEILSIEMFRQARKEIDGGHNVGLGLGLDVAADGFTGQSVSFLPRPGSGVPALTPEGWAVPDRVAVVVGWSGQRGAGRPRVAALVLDGLTVTLHDQDGSMLFSAAGPALTVTTIGMTRLGVTTADKVTRYLIGPEPRLARSPQAAALIKKYRAAVYPDLRLAAPPRWWQRLMITPAIRALNRKIIWQGVLLTMLRSRQVVIGGPPDAAHPGR
jgi:hypothetical protein